MGKVSQFKAAKKKPKTKAAAKKKSKAKAAAKKPPAGPLRRSSRLQNQEQQDVADVEVLTEFSQPETIAPVPPNRPSFQQNTSITSSTSTTLQLSSLNPEENTWHEQQESPPQRLVPETLDSIPPTYLVVRSPFSFRPPAPVDNIEITRNSISNVRLQVFAPAILHLPSVEEMDHYNDNAMDDGQYFVSEDDIYAAYGPQRAANEKGEDEFEAIRKANKAAAANMDVCPTIPPEGFDVYANNWGNTFAATTWPCEECFSPNPETTTKCLACEKDRPACKNAIETGVTTEQQASIGTGGFQFVAAATTTSSSATSANNLVLGSSSSSNVQAPLNTSQGGLHLTGSAAATASIGQGGFYFVASTNMADSSRAASRSGSASGSSAAALRNAPANGFVFGSSSAAGPSNTQQGLNGNGSSASAPSMRGKSL